MMNYSSSNVNFVILVSLGAPKAHSTEKYQGDYFFFVPTLGLWHSAQDTDPSCLACYLCPSTLNSPTLPCRYSLANLCCPRAAVPSGSSLPFKGLLIQQSLDFPFQRQKVGDYGSCLKLTTIFPLLYSGVKGKCFLKVQPADDHWINYFSLSLSLSLTPPLPPAMGGYFPCSTSSPISAVPWAFDPRICMGVRWNHRVV